MPEPRDSDEFRDTTDQTAEPTPARHGRPSGPMIAAGLLVVAAGVAIYLAFGDWSTSERTASTAATAESPEPTDRTQPLGGDALTVPVPPLEESDPFVRDLVAKLSSHPQVAAWLATDGLIRNFTVVVSNIAEGRTPAAQVRALRPSPPFRVTSRGEDLYVDPQSYKRYDGLAGAVASVDPAGSARLYATLKPRIEEAYRQLGEREALFDRTLERAIVLLLETPVTQGVTPVEPKGIGYGFADKRLEALTPAQKQLLRMGPENARTIQRRLREIALALGIPEERLPAPRDP